MENADLNKISDNAKASFTKEMEKLIKSGRYDVIINLAKTTPNDMDLGKAVRSLINKGK